MDYILSIISIRRSQNSLLKPLIFDPVLKVYYILLHSSSWSSKWIIVISVYFGFQVRVAAVATVSLMFEGPSRAFMQIAEYRDSRKCGSFMTLSYSLGQVLLQIQRGTCKRMFYRKAAVAVYHNHLLFSQDLPTWH